MARTIPKRIAATVMNSLKGGVVPRIGLEYIAVGRRAEIDALLGDIDIISDGGASFRFIVGKYGSGKSFLLQTIRNYAMEKNFVVIDADLSPERRLVGNKGQGLATYRELIKNISTKTKPDGGALPLILEKWLSKIQSEVAVSGIDTASDEFDSQVKARIFETLSSVEEMVNGFDFARIINLYLEAYKNGDDERKSLILKWFRGEYGTKTEARQALGVNIIITDDNWFDYIKIIAVFLVKAGYSGMMMMIDELLNLYRIPNTISRQYNYEKILTMYNDILQGKAQYIGVIMGGTPQCIEDTQKGVFSYDALRSRLEEGRISARAGLRDMTAPIIRLQALTYEEMYVLIEKLAEIHGVLYNYTPNISYDDNIKFLKIEFERIGADVNITPREVIRDYIELLNLASQNKNVTFSDLLSGENDSFKFARSIVIPDEAPVSDDFADFQL